MRLPAGDNRPSEAMSTASKAMFVFLAILGWVGVGIVSNFSKLVPHASPEEVKPFVIPVWVLALLLTAYAGKALMSARATK